MPASIELLSQTRVRIKDRQFKIHHSDPPLPDGSIYNLEVTADERDRVLEHLKPHELRNIQGREMPPGMAIMIDGAKSRLGRTIVHFDNLTEGPAVRLVVDFTYSDWHLPINLVTYAGLLRDEILRAGKDLLRRVSIDESGAGVYLFCLSPVPPTSDYYEIFQALDEHTLNSHRACLRSLMKDFQHALHDAEHRQPTDKSSSSKSDSDGLKWWVRYVVVPVAVGLVALVALLMR